MTYFTCPHCGQPLRITLKASDLDQDALTFSADDLPPGATITPQPVYGTALFEWTPTAADRGVHALTFRVTDDGNGGKVPVMEEDGVTPKMGDALDEAVMARLTQRGDDTVEALTKRLESFSKNRDAVAAAYSGISIELNGNRAPDAVWADICAYLEKEIPFP